MQRCTNCSRHVWETESRCPFCSAALRQVLAPVVMVALLGLALVACGGDDGGAETTAMVTMSASASGTDSVSSTNSAPTTSSSEMTTSATGTTSTPTTTLSSTSSDTSGTSGTTSSTSTSTSSEGTSTSSGSDSSSTAGTSGTGTTQMTTGGDCTGRGEQICGGACVNTLADNEHCGKCFNVCNENQGEFCDQGECILIMPYGAPMPDPLWV